MFARLRPLLFRLVSTLVVAPPLYLAAVLYIRVQTTGGDANVWAAAKAVGDLYVSATIPASILVIVFLMPLDYLLQRIGFGLTTIFISPFVAGLLVFALGDLFSEPHVQSVAAMLPLFVVYGLVWGLTIRDPAAWARRPAPA